MKLMYSALIFICFLMFISDANSGTLPSTSTNSSKQAASPAFPSQHKTWTWENTRSPSYIWPYVNGVYASGSMIYAATGKGLYISTNNGDTWVHKTTKNGLGSNEIYGVFSSGALVCAATAEGFSISQDNGETWVNKTTIDGLGDNLVFGVHVSGKNVYAATDGGLTKFEFEN